MPSSNRPPEPWHSFFTAMDEAVETITRLDCIGGFVVTQLFGLDRPTGDIDVIELAPRSAADTLMRLGQRGGPLHKQFGIYLDRVGIAAVPENYEDRLTEMFPGVYVHLRLMALDPYDLALSKLHRDSDKDRDDVRFLAKSIPFNLAVLTSRYNSSTSYLYPFTNPGNGSGLLPANSAGDKPGTTLPTDDISVSDTFSATMYLLWNPGSANAIDVPVASDTWGYTASTSRPSTSANWAPATTTGVTGTGTTMLSNTYYSNLGYPQWSSGLTVSGSCN